MLISALFSICFCFFFVFSCVPFRFRLLGTPSVYQSTLELTPTSYKDHCKRLYYLVEKQRELCGLSQNVLSVRLYTNLFYFCINLFICGSPGLNSQITRTRNDFAFLKCIITFNHVPIDHLTVNDSLVQRNSLAICTNVVLFCRQSA